MSVRPEIWDFEAAEIGDNEVLGFTKETPATSILLYRHGAELIAVMIVCMYVCACVQIDSESTSTLRSGSNVMQCNVESDIIMFIVYVSKQSLIHACYAKNAIQATKCALTSMLTTKEQKTCKKQ